MGNGLSWNHRLSLGSVTVILIALHLITATGAGAQAIQSDDFNSTSLNTTLWRFVDPLGDATLTMSGTNAIVYIPGGIKHNFSDTGILAPHLLQDAPDTDFEIEAKFDSEGMFTYQGQGIIVKEDDDTYIRFDLVYTTGGPRLFVGYFDAGVLTIKRNISVSTAPSYLRVTRTGNNWVLNHSYDGTVWPLTTQFDQSLGVTETGVFFNNTCAGDDTYWETPAFAGNVDYFFNTASPIIPEDGGSPSAETPPVVDVWYGNDQDFGYLGIPQQWMDIVGTVWDTDPITSLSYTLNGGSSSPLNFGPDGNRLVGVGDFNIEIDYTDLVSGPNEVVITALDAIGEQTDHVVTVSYTDGVTGALPDTAYFTTASVISDEAHIVDGRWHLTGQGVRVDSNGTGYDRMIVVGDFRWETNYEIVLPITVHAGDLGGPSGIGMAIGWQGFEGVDQPRLDNPFQAQAWLRDVTTIPRLILKDNGYVQEVNTVVQMDVRYLMKLHSQFIGAGMTRVSVKFYEDGTPEPANWDVTADVTPRDGSVVLVAHKAEVTFGDVSITPLPSLAHTLTTNVIGNGTIARDPDFPTQQDNTEVILTAVPDPGFALLEWSDGLSGQTNPSTILMVSDTTITATFVPAIVSDDFHAPDLNTALWQFIDPLGDATLIMSGTNAIVRVPGGIKHALSDTGIFAPHLLQDAPDIDFEVEAKFDSRGAFTYQGQGIIIKEDDDTYLRFDLIYTSGGPSLFVGYFDAGVLTTKRIISVPDSLNYLRAGRTGDNWVFTYSSNGTSWLPMTQFDQSIAVTAVGVFFNNTCAGESYWTTPAFVGNVDYFFNTAHPIVPEDGGSPSAETLPVVDVWYGDNQDFGHLGIPQNWVNIVGTVWDPDSITSLSYTLNGGSIWPLSIGPDGKRLVGVGDFNTEIPFSVLLPGANEVMITAVDELGEQTDMAVTINYTAGIPWEMPYTADWLSATKISDVSDVIDGLWNLTSDGVRTDSSAIGYDRLLVLGDRSWTTDYEVTVPMTFHAGNPIGSGFGIGVGWQGHEDGTVQSGPERSQPYVDARYQTIAWVRDFPSNPVLRLIDEGSTHGEVSVSMQANVPYRLKVRSESVDPFTSHVSVKFWEDGTPEPGSWHLEDDFTSVDGSVAVIAHMADVTFGDVEITPLPSFPLHILTTNVVGNGSITEVPGYASYAENAQVQLAAVPDGDWVFDGWSGGLSGDTNPITLTMVSDTTVTANFIPSGYAVDITVAGLGTVEVEPDKAGYLDGDTIIITAIPDPGYYFYGWSEGHQGEKNPDTLIVTEDISILATFFGVITGIKSPPSIRELTVLQNTPNPFTRETYLEFGLPSASDVEIRVYDVAGKRVFSKRITGASAGWNRYLFSGHDRNGAPLPSGVYFYKIRMGNAAVTNKMVIIR